MSSLKPLLVLGMSLLCACAANTDEATEGEGGEMEPETQEGAWEAQSVANEANSTHLWIVNRGVDILSRHAATDEVAKRTVAIMKDAQCKKQWQQGLYDADFKAEYNDGNRDLPANPSDAQVALAGSSWASHFFDPDTGMNYKGGSDKTAFTEANGHINVALGSRLQDKTAKGCYELGLALHYYTDLTQPMHAVNFTALDRPAKLHSNLEGYSMELQDRFPLADWSGAPTGKISDFVLQTAKDSKPLFMEGVKAIVEAYKSYVGWHILTCRNIDASAWRFIERQHLDYKHCWAGNPGVDAMVGNTIKSAQDHTAKFLYLVGKQLPAETTASEVTP